MDSYMENPFHEDHQSQQQNSGLLRFRTTPKSMLSNFDKDAAYCKGYDYNQSPRFLTITAAGGGGDAGDNSFESVESKPLLRVNSQNGLIGQSQLPPQYTKQSLVSTSGAMEGSYRVETAMEMGQSKKGNVVGGSNLARQSSSPAGFFVHLNAQNGYPMLRSTRNFKVGSGNNEESSPRTSRLSALSSSASLLPRIPETGNENVRETSPDGVRYRNGEHDARFYGPEFSFASWNDPARMVENSSEVGGDHLNDQMLYSGSDASISQNGGFGNLPHTLSHHLSLPRTAAEMAAIEKLLHFQDSVPCKIRAKRGCATHPRSIAERVRRTRISERMKKLQELVPNMEKQMNTADMLDLAVEYIKELQEQYKMLSDNRARCTCLNGHKSASGQAV
ncbi:hypothetical protein Ancab_030971 [Ancistrocladus abbreviatus]